MLTVKNAGGGGILQADLDALQAQLTQKEKELTEKASQITSLNTQITQKNSQITSLNAQIEQKIKELNSLKGNIITPSLAFSLLYCAYYSSGSHSFKTFKSEGGYWEVSSETSGNDTFRTITLKAKKDHEILLVSAGKMRVPVDGGYVYNFNPGIEFKEVKAGDEFSKTISLSPYNKDTYFTIDVGLLVG